MLISRKGILKYTNTINNLLLHHHQRTYLLKMHELFILLLFTPSMLHFTLNFQNDTQQNYFKISHNTFTGIHLISNEEFMFLALFYQDRNVPNDRIRVGTFYRNSFKITNNSKVQIVNYNKHIFKATLIIIENENEKFIEIIKGMKYIKRGFTFGESKIVEIQSDEKGSTNASFYEYIKNETRFYIKRNFRKVYGMDNQIMKFEKMIYAPLILHDRMKEYNLEQNSTYLFHSFKGMYEQDFLQTVCQNLHINYLYFDFIDSNVDEFETSMKSISSLRPCLISFDNIVLKSTECVKLIRGFIKRILKENHQFGAVIIINTNNTSDVEDYLKTFRFEKVFYLKQLETSERKEIIEQILNKVPNNIKKDDIDIIAEGFKSKTIEDIERVFRDCISNKIFDDKKQLKPVHESVIEKKPFDYSNYFLNEIDNVEEKLENVNLKHDFLLTYQDFVPILFNEIYTSQDVSIEKSNVNFSDIGGYADVKNILKESVVWNITHKDLFKKMNVKPPKGIILYGPPGCSKTLFARAIAGESKMSFISIKGSELEDKWVGETDKSIRNLFRKAREKSPCIIFIDEIDSIAQRSTNVHHTKTISAFLTEMDGFTENENLIIIGATNRIENIDEAFLRPGRIDKKIKIDFPDLEARNEIFRIKLGYSVDAEYGLLTENMTGAEITLICQEAKMMVIRRQILNNKDDKLHVTNQDLKDAIENLKNKIF